MPQDSAASTRPYGLMVDLQHDPVGVDTVAPRLSWIVPAIGDGMQQVYRIQVAGSPESFDRPVWDSGPVGSAESVAVGYCGPQLCPSTPYWWRVLVHTSQAGDWSEPARFVTRIYDWGGDPIWAPDDGSGSSWALLRTVFELPDQPVLAAYVEAAGLSPEGGPTDDGIAGGRQYVYKLWANAEVVGRGSVRGSDDRARYHTHDVTGVVRRGPNALAALCWAEHGRQFVARLVVVLAGGERIEVPTSTDWRAVGGGRMLPGSQDIGGGWYRAPREDWDLRTEPVGWTGPGFDDHDWAPAVRAGTLPAPAPAIVSIAQHVGAPVRARRQAPGRWFVDLGREIVGGIRLELSGTAGQRVIIRLGEELEHGRVRFRLRTGNVYQDTWTLRDGPQSVEHWGFRAFRYVELDCDPDLDLTRAVSPVVLHAPYVGGGSFRSSDPDLDRVWELCRYTIEATSLDLYLDTPARERGPYEGDAFVNQLSQYAVERSYALARYSGEYLTRRPTWPAEYHLMPVLIAWQDYLATGDDRQLRTDFELWEQLGYDRLVGDDGLLHKPPVASGWDAELVDWPPVFRDGYDFTEVNTVVNAFQCAAWAALADIAAVIDRPEAAERYRRLADRMRDMINSRLLDDVGYRDGLESDHRAQHATAIPVALGIAPANRLPGLGAWLAAGGVRVSIYAAQFLLDALCRAGSVDAAVGVLTASGPSSWLHVIDDLGATIAPEAWDPELKPNMTFSHAWGSAPVNVVARWLLGVRPEAPGAERIVIEPRPGQLVRMSGTVPTIRGDVVIDFDRRAGTLTVTVPANTTARIVLHKAELGVDGPLMITAGGRPVAAARSGDRVETARVGPGEVAAVWEQ